MHSGTRSRQSAFRIASITALILLQGCASTADKAYQEGWRNATVVQPRVGRAVVDNVVKDCRAERAASDGTARYALLSYADRGSAPKYYVAAVPPDLGVRAEQWYQVNVTDCASRWHRSR